jgi:signal peptidase II
MKAIVRACGYLLLSMVVILVDRLTKAYALQHFVTPLRYNSFMCAELVLNRGISWGMFSFDNQWLFIGICSLVAGICILLGHYAARRFAQGHVIVGEILVCAGAVSNLIDRLWYGGVVDFILISYGSWTFPVFNIADMCIVIGVAIMCLFSLSDTR